MSEPVIPDCPRCGIGKPIFGDRCIVCTSMPDPHARLLRQVLEHKLAAEAKIAEQAATIKQLTEAHRQTRFDDFDSTRHPASKWWKKYGQHMLSGGGRREFIWACRGWIAREQMMEGVKVTGESTVETQPPQPKEPA